MTARGLRRFAVACAVASATSSVGACGLPKDEAPHCGDLERVALIAQSVPSATVVPCVTTLAAGWSSDGSSVRDGSARFVLHSDRSPGHPVTVTLTRRCSTGQATPVPPRAPGVRSALWLAGIDPRYAGSLFDVFAGGCVVSRFDFRRGDHIGLMADLQRNVVLLARSELRRELRARLGIVLR